MSTEPSPDSTSAGDPERGTWLVATVAFTAFFGVLWLGYYYDDFSNMAYYQEKPYSVVVRSLNYNRFPIFALVLYPLLLKLPAALSHLLVIAVHTAGALLLRSVLRGFGYSERVAVGAALLFLLAPSQAEALHWVVASTVVFGVMLMLASTREVQHGRDGRGGVLAFVSMLFSEAILLPVALLHLVVLLRRPARLPRVAAHLAALVAAYGGFQLIRSLVSLPGSLTQYKTGLTHMALNAGDLLRMTFGVMTSRDINWVWNRAPISQDVTLLLPPWMLVLATVLMGGVVYALSRLPAEPLRPRPLLLGVAGALAGSAAAVAIFLIVTGNSMQPRYTYVLTLFLAVLFALLLGALDRGQTPRAVAGMVLTLLLGWSLYRAWSSIWSNWYPARLVLERIVRDVDETARETDAQQIFVVNAPKAVGHGYVLMAYWAYESVGKLLLSRPVLLDAYPRSYLSATGERAGLRFTDTSCVFMGWDKGQRVMGKRAFDPLHRLVLDCEKGTAEPPGEGPLPTLRYTETAEVALREIMGLHGP